MEEVSDALAGGDAIPVVRDDEAGRLALVMDLERMLARSQIRDVATGGGDAKDAALTIEAVDLDGFLCLEGYACARRSVG